ncbi:MAG: zinc ribbon domain-containing protein [Chloroflexi bacterium]|nr:zinc ribbon domain-containing protein [Chloroflexota bacterium]MBU1749896.1 zinc ribbon domain-containing protein [Chloroflexota bacterium]MBU1879642.1 zinc ribbon domain-containing protein [Chloroflexota bacterium]
MSERKYRGNVTPGDLAEALVNQFNRGDYRAAKSGRGTQAVVQISTNRRMRGEPDTAVSVTITPTPEGVHVSMGDPQWLDIAADLVQTGIGALLNPWSLVREVDDVARNVQDLNLPQEVWQAIDQYAKTVGSRPALLPEPTSVTCPYCRSGNAIGEGRCENCGAPLGDAQPVRCPSCQRLLAAGTSQCPQCGERLAVAG